MQIHTVLFQEVGASDFTVVGTYSSNELAEAAIATMKADENYEGIDFELEVGILITDLDVTSYKSLF